MDKYLCCWEKKQFSRSRTERHSKINFSSFFIKPWKINLIKPLRVSKIEKINLPCMLQTQKGSQFSDLFLALSFIKTFFQLRFYSDMEINVSTSFIIIIIANSSYLLNPCFFRHHARHFYIYYMSSSWYFSKTGISGPVLHMVKCSNKCKVTPQLVPRSTGLHSTLHSPRTSLVFLLAAICPNWSMTLYLSDLASPFPWILWSELTKYNGASWHRVSCERDTQTRWVTVKTGAAEGLCPLNQWPGALWNTLGFSRLLSWSPPGDIRWSSLLKFFPCGL